MYTQMHKAKGFYKCNFNSILTSFISFFNFIGVNFSRQ